MGLYDEESTILDFLATASAAESGRRVALLIYHRDGVQVVPLVDGQPVTIGRTRPSTLTLRDKSLSRRHARFERQADDLWVMDLGSTNGTRVNGTPVRERVRLRDGDQVTLGSVSITVHRITLEEQLQGLDSHDRFLAQLEDEVTRARTFDRKLALLMVEARERNSLARWCPRVRCLLRAVDRIALYGPDTVELLLSEASFGEAEALASAIVARPTEGAVEPPLFCGIAVFPESASSPEALLEESRRAVREATEQQPVRVRGIRDPLAPLNGRPDTGPDDEANPVVRSELMNEVFRTVAQVAPTPIPVMIVGETGTGKEVVARALHRQSDRATGPLRCVNCGAIPEHLVESALFGHERGAFTGADRRAKGVFEDADGGTVFFDEIGELALSSQVALLRVLETRRIARVGSSREVPVDVRVVAATHRDLESMCDRGEFRTDLFYRLNTVVLHLPPLRERLAEVIPLVDRFVRRVSRSLGRPMPHIEPEVLDVLRCYHWPGNVRELRNVVERAVVIARSDRVSVDDLPERLRAVAAAFPAARAETRASSRQPLSRAPAGIDWDDLTAPPRSEPTVEFRLESLKSSLQRFETELIREALIRTSGNQSEAAVLLGLPRRTLVYKLKSYGIERRVDDLEVTPLSELEDDELDFGIRVAEHEAELLRQRLEAMGGNHQKAARSLGIPVRSLAQKAKKHGLV